MKNLKSIVVGVDFSKNADSALLEAARIARWEGAKLTAVHVLDAHVFSDINQQVALEQDDVAERAYERLRERIDSVLGANHGVQCEFVIGHPLRELMKSVGTHDADLLVLGAHGLDHGSRKKVGALAGKCARKSPADVLLVREREDQPFHKITVCIDFSENSKKAARHAIHIAQMDLASIEFLHIHQPIAQYFAAAPDYITGAFAFTPAHDAQVVAELKTSLETLASELVTEAGGCDYSAKVVQGFDLRGTIADHVNETGSDLVVLGVRGRSNLRNMLIGTTAENIIHSASCSTLAVKPSGFDYRLD
jgi:nucleotide-binding universal stress UspA family protein